MAGALDGEWREPPPSAEQVVRDLDHYRGVRATYAGMDAREMALDKPTRTDYWRTGPGHPGVVLDDAERERMLDAQPDRYLSATQAAELLEITPAALAAACNASTLVPEIGVLSSKYRTIAAPAAPRPSAWYLRSSVERFARRSPAPRREVRR